MSQALPQKQRPTAGQKILVIGAGVSGLSSAIRLLEEGYDVEIWTKEVPTDTTSATAAAFWDPYLVAPEEQAAQWGGTSYRVFGDLAQQGGVKIGVEVRPVLLVYREQPNSPKWRDCVNGYQEVTRQEIVDWLGHEPPSDITHGIVFDSYMIEMPKYLPFLLKRFQDLGGHLEERVLNNLAEAFESHDIVVNCSALGSRDIQGIEDEHVHPVAGQVVQIRRTGQHIILFDPCGKIPEKPTYVVPRGDNVILGGTAIDGRYDRTIEPAITDDIVERCREFLPDLETAEIQKVMMGLRPARYEVRLEREEHGPGKVLIHNYGHGGGGVTLSWGCSEDVLALVEETASQDAEEKGI